MTEMPEGEDDMMSGSGMGMDNDMEFKCPTCVEDCRMQKMMMKDDKEMGSGMKPEGEGEGEDMMSPPGHHMGSQYCSSAEEFAAGNCRGCEKLCMTGTRYEEDMGRNMACNADCCEGTAMESGNDCTDGVAGPTLDHPISMNNTISNLGQMFMFMMTDKKSQNKMDRTCNRCAMACIDMDMGKGEGEGEKGYGEGNTPEGEGEMEPEDAMAEGEMSGSGSGMGMKKMKKKMVCLKKCMSMEKVQMLANAFCEAQPKPEGEGEMYPENAEYGY